MAGDARSASALPLKFWPYSPLLSSSYAVLVFAGVVGVISTSGGECGPFLAIEQAALTDAVLAHRGLLETGTMLASVYVASLTFPYLASGDSQQADCL